MLASFSAFAHKLSKPQPYKKELNYRSSYILDTPSYVSGNVDYLSRQVDLGSWGPPKILFQNIYLPENEKAEWLIMIAKYFVGVPYKSRRNPRIGIDCSTFTSFIYNYALGIQMGAGVIRQASLMKTRIYDFRKLKKGDLLFFKRPYKELYHVAIYIDENTLIDSTSNRKTGGVNVRSFSGWYKENFAFGGRVLN